MQSRSWRTPQNKLICLAATVLFVGSVSAEAQQLRIVVPFAAGGAVDKVARVIANQLPPEMGAIVDNRDGAGGDLGVNATERAPPNGKTVLLHTSSLLINSAYRKGEAQSALSKFQAVAKVGAVKFVLVVRKGLPVTSIAELIAYNKSGTRLKYGSTGNGTTLHVAGEMLKQAANLNATHIPYRGLAPAFNDLVAGNIDFMVTSVSGVVPFVKDGSMRPLAVFHSERAEEMPEVPTTAQAGYNELEISNWYGIFVPTKVPAETRKQLEDAFLTAVRSSEVQRHFKIDGVSGEATGERFERELSAEAERLPPLLKRLGISAAN